MSGARQPSWAAAQGTRPALASRWVENDGRRLRPCSGPSGTREAPLAPDVPPAPTPSCGQTTAIDADITATGGAASQLFHTRRTASLSSIPPSVVFLPLVPSCCRRVLSDIAPFITKLGPSAFARSCSQARGPCLFPTGIPSAKP